MTEREEGEEKAMYTDQNIWISHVRYKIADNLTKYINYYLQEKDELPWNQNILE